MIFLTHFPVYRLKKIKLRYIVSNTFARNKSLIHLKATKKRLNYTTGSNTSTVLVWQSQHHTYRTVNQL